MDIAFPTLVTFLIYLALMIGIGVATYRLTASLSDYVLGGRSLGPGVAALSAGASDMSGWLLLGLPGAIYASGMASAWIAIGWPLALAGLALGPAFGIAAMVRLLERRRPGPA